MDKKFEEQVIARVAEELSWMLPEMQFEEFDVEDTTSTNDGIQVFASDDKGKQFKFVISIDQFEEGV